MEGPLGLCDEVPIFSDIRLTDGKVGSPTRRPPLHPGNFLVLISVRGWVAPRAILRLEGLGKLKKSTSSVTRTGDLPACSILPQPTMLPPVFTVRVTKFVQFTQYNTFSKIPPSTSTNFATRVRTWRVARLYSVLYSGVIALPRKPLWIRHVYIYTFCLVWLML
jgi:hypothetical protein